MSCTAEEIRICRENGITHLLTAPRSPTTTGKVERLHQSLRRELLDDAGVFVDLPSAQAPVDGLRLDYNTRRPHQSLGMAFPADVFAWDAADDGQQLLPLRLPATLVAPVPAPRRPEVPIVEPVPVVYAGGPVEFDRVVPPSGNPGVAGRQFWLGPARAGVRVTFWADTDVIHLLVAGARVKTVRSHLSVNDLAVLARDGGRAAGPSPLRSTRPARRRWWRWTGPIRCGGTVCLGQHIVLVAEILGGRRVGARIELSAAEILKLQGARPPGPPPLPSTDPVVVQRRVSGTGTISVAWQRVALGRSQAGETVTVEATDTHLRITCGDQTRTNTNPVNWVKPTDPQRSDPVRMTP